MNARIARHLPVINRAISRYPDEIALLITGVGSEE